MEKMELQLFYAHEIHRNDITDRCVG